MQRRACRSNNVPGVVGGRGTARRARVGRGGGTERGRYERRLQQHEPVVDVGHQEEECAERQRRPSKLAPEERREPRLELRRALGAASAQPLAPGPLGGGGGERRRKGAQRSGGLKRVERGAAPVDASGDAQRA